MPVWCTFANGFVVDWLVAIFDGISMLAAYLGILVLGYKAHDRVIQLYGTDKETASLCKGNPRRSPIL